MSYPANISPDDALLAIWESHRPNTLERVSLIERAAAALIAGELDEQLRSEAQRSAHMLTGSVGTFGFARASEAARELELKLANPVRANVPSISALIVTVRSELERETALPKGRLPSEPAHDRLRVLLILDDPGLCERIAAEAAARGIDCETAASTQKARELYRDRPPTIVLLDLTLPGEGAMDAYELLSELTSATPSIPVLVLTGSEAFTDRVEAARRGGRAFLPKSLLPAEALDAAQLLLARERLEATRVLVVDDDPTILETMRAILEPHDLEVLTLADPLRFWEKLEEALPELLILDVDMPGVNGPELCRVVRNDPRWSHIGVIFVTAKTDAATIEEVFRAGADDYLTKPIVGSELITRVSNRLDRIRLYRARAETDNLTGLANRAKAGEGLTQLVSLADRFSQVMSLAMLDLDRFKLVNDDHGHAAGDSVLRRLAEHLRRDFRGDDVVGRWGGEEFIVGMYGMTREDGVRRLTDTLERFGEERFTGSPGAFRASFSAGIAEYPLDGRDLGAIAQAADEALYRAKAAGRARVLAADREVLTEQCDVACVEDDEALAELLLASLATHGYSTRRFADGAKARAALCGAQPALRCRVLLLDVDLPGLDGHSLLRQLAHYGVLRSTRVIMLTARAGEPDTLEALKLGAFDHVAKPFSLPILMHRVQNAMEA
jgi:diguanylate cyclase (GGDEF)-like protein